MRKEFTAVIERDEAGFVAFCPDVPGANGQGHTKAQAIDGLRAAIELIVQCKRALLVSRVAQAERDIAAGQGVNWRGVRADV